MKIDIRAMRRVLNAIEKEVKRLGKVRDRAYAMIAKYPRPLQQKNRLGTGQIAMADKELDRLEAQRLKIAALITEVGSCTDSCSTECQTTRANSKKVVDRAPVQKKAVKRAKPPTEHDQKLIAQAHWFALMLRQNKRLHLPDIPIPATDWRPDGARQVSHYAKIWRDVFDGIFWEAADIAISELGDDSDRAEDIARAIAPNLFEAYKRSGGNVQSLDHSLRKGKNRIPLDLIFFPDEARSTNPKKRKAA